ncbi:MAG TPA: NAD(P)-dependent alcohol dehydrogenase [Polyangiaceae bacterium]|nr:NAD(P)-dependent alcohol dehydrogenase [Polyangiaceae bacterium]
MWAAVYYAFGGPEVLRVEKRPRPTVSRGHVLVRVRASGVNPRDAVVRSGAYRHLMTEQFPKGTGADFAGEVAQVGPGVRDLAVGDAVYGYVESLESSTAAQLISVPAKAVALKPITLSQAQAASMPCAYLTALQALRDKARLRAGQRLLVYGASGGVGTAAVQLANYLEAHVVAVSSARNREHCMYNGANETIAYDAGPDVFEGEPRYDVVFQVARPELDLYPKAARVLVRGGVFVSLNPDPSLELRGWLRWVTEGRRFTTLAVEGRRADLEYIAALADRAILRPRIEATLPLENVREAHRRVAGRHVRGKLVLNVA